MTTRQGALGPPLPPALLDRVAGAPKVVEVGAGRDFATALALKAASPATQVLVTDVNAAVREAPPQLAAFVDDVTRPTMALYEGAALVYGVRLPEELQVPTARLARKVGAAYACRPLKDEWADVRGSFARHEVLGGGWRFYS